MPPPLRSVLYMPGSNARALEKAKTLAADALIFDLEDAVAPEAKDSARQQVCEAVLNGDYGNRTVVVRINGMDTPWGGADLQAVVEANPDAILSPKVSSAEEAISLSEKMNQAGAKDTRLWIMMETPRAILNAQGIAATSQEKGNRLACFILGTNDLAKETRAHLTPSRFAMIPWISQCILAARAYGLSILDGVYNDFKDTEGFRAECLQGLELGMDGKTLIHPNQLDLCNEIFSPSREEVEWAKTVVAIFEAPENANVNVISIEGKMVERLHAEMAKRVVEIANSIANL